jgi:hypothetical protein
MLEGVTGLAQLQLAEGDFERAYGLSLLVLDHPATKFLPRSRADQINSSAAERLGADQIHRARERAAQTPLQAAIAALSTS